MGKKCDCYHTQIEQRYTHHITAIPVQYEMEVGVCWGTKERDRCSCNGDRIKCDFYSEVREKAINEQKNNRIENSDDCLIVTYDYCHSDVPTLCIAREERDKVRVLNTIQGDQAFGMYYYLTGNAELKEKEIVTNADKIRSMNDKELAEFLSDFHGDKIAMDEICHAGLCLEDENCVGCTLKWLQKPVKEE